uniref:Uncharacterized protein n=1 Tax=Arion vulgaris TaxID=1028688 RepID=A0A0B7B931_9EUPU
MKNKHNMIIEEEMHMVYLIVKAAKDKEAQEKNLYRFYDIEDYKGTWRGA